MATLYTTVEICRNRTCNWSCICLFYNFLILANIAMIFVYKIMMHFSVLNLLVQKGESANYVTF